MTLIKFMTTPRSASVLASAFKKLTRRTCPRCQTKGEVRRREAKGRRMSVGMGVYLVHYMYYMEARKLHIKVDPAL